MAHRLIKSGRFSCNMNLLLLTGGAVRAATAGYTNTEAPPLFSVPDCTDVKLMFVFWRQSKPETENQSILKTTLIKSPQLSEKCMMVVLQNKTFIAWWVEIYAFIHVTPPGCSVHGVDKVAVCSSGHFWIVFLHVFRFTLARTISQPTCVRYFLNFPPICEKHSLDGSSVTLTSRSSTTNVWIVRSIKIKQLGFHPEKQELCAQRPHRGIFPSPNQRYRDLRNPPAYERTSTMELETKPEQSVGQKQSARTRTARRITCKHHSIIS